MSDFKVSTLNLNGARDVRKRANVFELMKLKGINVMLLQETHSDTLNETDWSREWDGDVVLSHLDRVSGGVALLFSRNFLPKSYELEERIKGRLMVSPQELEAVLEDLKSKKAVLADLLGSKAQGALVRSRFQSAALMDLPQSFFFGLEKKNGQSRRSAVQFYAQLYQSEYTKDEGAFNSSCSGLPRFSEETNKELEGPLTSEEVFAVLQSMKGRKASRIDGLPPEFYRAFSFRGAQ
ncbi:hypothetical protein L3Q82_012152 [Scortum barcoo]|uniref:Uncharacterized protein n=1 Tax=Scortum barcoo TaxID=214431 RepID=A0ACB8W736_9TELE|nr:hypothetical protein L3Q82_012152 [Scortum barcoo]